MNLAELLDLITKPAKDQLKEEMIRSMDACSRILVVTRRLSEELNIFDSSTYADILNQQAQTHFELTKGMSAEDLMSYMSKGSITNDTKNL